MSVRISFTAIRANSRQIVGDDIREQLEDHTREFMADVIIKTQEYPGGGPGSSAPGSKYIRTGRLLRNWKFKKMNTGNGIQYHILNPVQDPRGIYYSGLVHGPSAQLAVHRGHGWKNIRDVMEELGGRAKFAAGVQRIIQKGIKY